MRDHYRMALPDGLPDRKELHIFKAIYLLKDEIFVWGIDQPDDSFCRITVSRRPLRNFSRLARATSQADQFERKQNHISRYAPHDHVLHPTAHAHHHHTRRGRASFGDLRFDRIFLEARSLVFPKGKPVDYSPSDSPVGGDSVAIHLFCGNASHQSHACGNKKVVCCFGLVEFQTVVPKALLPSLSVNYRHLGW